MARGHHRAGPNGLSDQAHQCTTDNLYALQSCPLGWETGCQVVFLPWALLTEYEAFRHIKASAPATELWVLVQWISHLRFYKLAIGWPKRGNLIPIYGSEKEADEVVGNEVFSCNWTKPIVLSPFKNTSGGCKKNVKMAPLNNLTSHLSGIFLKNKSNVEEVEKLCHTYKHHGYAKTELKAKTR